MMVTMATDTPTVHDLRFITQHTVYVDLTDSSERLLPRYKSGKFRPDTVELRWTRSTATGATWKLDICKVSGPMVKKDDTDSMNQGDRDFVGYNRESMAMPAWLSSMVETYSTTLPED